MSGDVPTLEYGRKPAGAPPLLRLFSILFVFVGIPLLVFGLWIVCIGVFGYFYSWLDHVIVAGAGLLPTLAVFAWGLALKIGWSRFRTIPR